MRTMIRCLRLRGGGGRGRGMWAWRRWGRASAFRLEWFAVLAPSSSLLFFPHFLPFPFPSPANTGPGLTYPFSVFHIRSISTPLLLFATSTAVGGVVGIQIDTWKRTIHSARSTAHLIPGASFLPVRARHKQFIDSIFSMWAYPSDSESLSSLQIQQQFPSPLCAWNPCVNCALTLELNGDFDIFVRLSKQWSSVSSPRVVRLRWSATGHFSGPTRDWRLTKGISCYTWISYRPSSFFPLFAHFRHAPKFWHARACVGMPVA